MPKKKPVRTIIVTPNKDWVKRIKRVKVDFVTETIGSEGVPLCLPYRLISYGFPHSSKVNNLVPVWDYTFVGQLSPSSLLDLVKEISICMMRALSLLN